MSSPAASSSAATASGSSGKAFQFNPADRIKGFSAPTVWHEFTPLANAHKAVNLGQGFPGWHCPDFLKEENTKACNNNYNQYARSAGHLSLVQGIAKRYSKTFGRTVDPLTEVVVTAGATEAIFGVTQGLLNPGDEVIAFEPAFDIYLAQTDMAGAKVVPVPLILGVDDAKSGSLEWKLDIKRFEAAFTSKTRLVLLNTPHNPTGKVFTKDELGQIAAVVSKYPNVVVVSDEVYEYLTYDGHEHISFASLPGMWERTITVSSAGKTFSVTGWKVGWTVGPEYLVRCVGISHQWVSFSVCTHVQEAIAQAFIIADSPFQGHPTYYKWLQAMYTQKRDFMLKSLREAGLNPITPQGSFFIIGQTGNVKVPEPYGSDASVTRDWSLCRWLTKDIGVAAIPPSAFYCVENKPMASTLARFAFCQPDDVLQEGAKRLLKVREHCVKQ